MQDDVSWGVKYLVAKGIADPKRVGIMGGSYGGYTTLAGVAFTPELYKAGVDIVGPSNLITLLDAIPPYWEAGRKMMYARMADPGTDEGKKWLAERSPLNAAAKIKAPLMVVQGANDPRVNKGEAEQIVIALRDHGLPVEYLLAGDEGHGFARPVNNMAMFMAIEKFLARHLDGRYQEGGKPEVVKRLAELRVDPKTVTPPAKKAGGRAKPDAICRRAIQIPGDNFDGPAADENGCLDVYQGGGRPVGFGGYNADSDGSRAGHCNAYQGKPRHDKTDC